MASNLEQASFATVNTTEMQIYRKKVNTRTIERVAYAVGLTTDMTKEATDMYRRVSETPLYNTTLRCRKAFRGVVPGGCVHIVCRLHGWSDTLNRVSEIVHTQPNVLGFWARQIARNLAMQIPDPMPVIKPNLNLDKEKDATVVSKTVEELAVSIVDVCWEALCALNDRAMLSFDSASLVFSVARYMAWQAEEPMSRGTLTRKQFCEISRTESHFPSLLWNKVWADMQSVLCRFARQIPWVNNQVEAGNVVMYIKDVCAHHKRLLASTSMKELVECVGLDDRDLAEAATQNRVNATECCEPAAILVQDMVVTAPGTFDPYTIVVVNNPDARQPLSGRHMRIREMNRAVSS